MNDSELEIMLWILGFFFYYFSELKPYEARTDLVAS